VPVAALDQHQGALAQLDPVAFYYGLAGARDDVEPLVRAPRFITSTLNTKLWVSAGQAVLAKGDESIGTKGGSQRLVIVAARVVDAGPRSGK
jgi:hypothetical protein